LFVFRLDKGSNIETKSSVHESLGIFQLIDQIETAVDKLLERQVPVHFAFKGGGYASHVRIGKHVHNYDIIAINSVSVELWGYSGCRFRTRSPTWPR
jgi:hypothetical protein